MEEGNIRRNKGNEKTEVRKKRWERQKKERQNIQKKKREKIGFHGRRTKRRMQRKINK